MSNWSDSSQSGTPFDQNPDRNPDRHSDQNASAQSVQAQLQSGLTALKHKNYPEAIAHLEAVHELATDVATLSKTQMGLVKAYAQTGRVISAVALCRSLCNNPDPQVRAWATQTLQKLNQRSASAPVTPPVSPKTATPEETRDAPVDETGFVPLTQPPSPSTAEGTAEDIDETGFVPLSPPLSPQNVSSTPVQGTPIDRPTRPAMSDDDDNTGDLAAYTAQWGDKARPDADADADNDETEDLAAYLSDFGARTSDERDRPIQPSSAPPSTESTEPSFASGLETGDDSSTQPSEPAFNWRQAGRAQKWTSLGKVDVTKLWALQALTVLLLILIVRALVQVSQAIINGLLFFFSWIPFLRSIRFEGDPFWVIVIVLVLLFVASPWILTWILTRFYQAQPLPLTRLEQHSPETVRLLRRVNSQQRQPIPTLSLLPTDAPVAFTYGYLPRHTRIVVSRGLLEHLSDDEIATVYAAELGHVIHRTAGVMSWVVAVAQLPYLVYWYGAAWGDRQRDRVLQSVGVLVSSIAYGMYRACRWAGLWLSRARLYYSDRMAAELTGNPNGLTRALLKMTLRMAEAIQEQQSTSPVLESVDLLMPVGHRSALTLGSVYSDPNIVRPRTALLEWDRHNRYRRWLAFNNSHPPIGDRLTLLTLYAQHWRLDTELNWEQDTRSTSSSPSFKRFLLQGSPVFGVLFGLLVSLCLMGIGWIFYRARWSAFDWLWWDRNAILLSCLLLGFGIGVLLRINASYPDIKRSNLQADPSLATLLTDPTAIPIDSIPVQFHGTLLGRRKFQNRMHQDLLLQTQTGLVRLHYTSRGGFLGNLVSQSRRPTDLMKLNQPVIVTGWFRRGATPWMDVDTIQAKQGTTVRSGHPVWSTVLAIASALLGVYLLL